MTTVAIESLDMLKMNIAEVDRLRIKLNLSKAGLAEKIGMTPSRLSDVLGKRGNVTLNTLGEIADALGCDPRTLLLVAKPVKRKKR